MKKLMLPLCAAVTLAVGFVAGTMYGTAKAPTPKPAAAPTKAENTAKAQAPTNAPESAELRVLGVSYDGDTTIRVTLSKKPEIDGIRQYVSVEPLASEGTIGIACLSDYDYSRKVHVPILVVTGEFAHRTNVTLRIRRGLSPAGSLSDAKNALAEDYVYKFRRKDLDPAVRFPAGGRYLPPGGRRAIAVESVNMASVQAEIRRVEPANIVQLLAREEGVYKKYYGSGGDSEDTLELAGEATKAAAPCANVPNVRELWNLPVKVSDGGPANGIYLVTAGNGEKPFCDEIWRRIGENWVCRGDWYNAPEYHLVCISDIGLSVRTSGRSGESRSVGVWATSLMGGQPLDGVHIAVYSQTNVKVMEGETGLDGWCTPRRVATGEPFAVVATARDGGDMTFMALSDRLKVDETWPDGHRVGYLDKDDCTGFAWTERGIYRHGEKIFFGLVVRNGEMKAPKPFPVVMELISPLGGILAHATMTPDETGTIACDSFSVPGEQPSGKWTLRARIPGDNGRILGSTTVKVEEFAPPQIRVRVMPDESAAPGGFSFAVSAEHLFGQPAQSLDCEGAVVFEDAPFSPDGWKDYSFGNDDLGLKPNFRRLDGRVLDVDGRATFAAPLGAEVGRPKAMVRATCQGVAFEDGGRPATARQSALLHFYPYYLGSTLGDLLLLPAGSRPTIRLACVAPDGTRLAKSISLSVKIERIDTVYSCRENPDGWSTWDCERIRSTVADGIQATTSPDADTEIALPLDACGDYAVTASDRESGVSYSRRFYLGGADDDAVRASLSSPAEVSIRTDKPFYRVGESPRLVVKSPFAGHALLTVMRETQRLVRVLNLTNATSEVVLPSVERSDAPNLNVFLSVVRSANAANGRLAARAHGQATVQVRPAEYEIPVAVKTKVEFANAASEGAGSRVTVDISAPGADSVDVSLVDEGINQLVDSPEPDPVGFFSERRCAKHPLYDLYGRLLPVLDGELKASGVKTGGDTNSEMLGRVSPVASRRFKPLSLWNAKVPVADGRAQATFDLPEFSGEVRVTVVAKSATATGAASMRQKISPALVMEPDAPRFVAPGDTFEVSMPLRNTGGKPGEAAFSIAVRGAEGEAACADGRTMLAANGSTNVTALLKAPAEPGHIEIVYRATGLGESHMRTIDLPVRPAVPWIETCGTCPESEWRAPAEGKWSARVFDSPLGGYEAALRWLAEYPHGCLEQTASRIFPLVAAGGMLNSVVSNGTSYAAAGVRRVESMIRAHDFVMWPDCTYPPWDREVSVYAAHFLVAAEKAGLALAPGTRKKIVAFLRRWALSDDSEISAYASMVLAQAGAPERDRMFRLYDARKSLSALSRARLSLAFSATDDHVRATTLLAESFEPQSVKEAAFALLAILECNPRDPRAMPLVTWLDARRDKSRLSWGTTSENAHALMAIGSFFRARPAPVGERFVSWRRLTLPAIEDVKDDSAGLFVSRRFLRPDGSPAELASLRCGELLVAELAVTSSATRIVGDLVLEDLLPGAFEPVRRDLGAACVKDEEWVMRKDARDDRVLVFSKKVRLEEGRATKTSYRVRVVSAGDYVLPGASVEGMYNPGLHSRRAPGRVVVRH